MPLSGPVMGWQGQTASLEARLWSGEAYTVIATGVVTADGQVRLELPAEINESLLVLAPELSCDGLEDSTPDARLALLSALTVLESGVSFDIALASSQQATFPWQVVAGEFRVHHWYADRAVEITGQCRGGSAADTWQLSLSPGWNVAVEFVREGPGGTLRREWETVPAPEGAQWFGLDAVTPLP